MSSAEEAAPPAGDGKLKLLCLHGFLQTGSVFRMRVGSLRKALKSRVDFAFADAPFHAASTLTEEQLRRFGGSGEGLSWFCWQDLGQSGRPSQAVKYSRWDEAYASLCDALRATQPDGLLGFSQGATAASLFLASLKLAQQQGRDLDVPMPRLAIMCAGFLPNDPDYVRLLQQAKVDVPALFIAGQADALIPPARTQALMATFDPATAVLFEHPGAHFVPTCSGEFKATLLGFLGRFGASAPAAAPGAASTAGSSLDSLDESGREQEADALAAALGESRM